MRPSTIYIVVIIACIYYLDQYATKYKNRWDIVSDVAANVLGASFGGLIGDIATSGAMEGMSQLY